jgi:hypothetical protein
VLAIALSNAIEDHKKMVPRAGIEPATRGFSTSLGNVSGFRKALQTVMQLHDVESNIHVSIGSKHSKSFHLGSFK